MREVVVAGAARTPIGRFGGALASLTAADLGASAGAEALRRAGIPPTAVDATIVGCARQAGCGPNVARQVSLRAGVPREVTAFTVNMACGSGLKAIDLAFRQVRDGDAEVVLAGGTESMSHVPYLLAEARWGHRMGHHQVIDAMYQDGFFCPMAEMVMGETAEGLADSYGISRAEQDAFALRSQSRAGAALRDGRFESETFSVLARGRKGDVEVRTDEHPRPATTASDLAKLAPAFRPEGTVTAGNSSGITDGAAAVVVLSSEKAASLGVEPMARVLGAAEGGSIPASWGRASSRPSGGCWQSWAWGSGTSTSWKSTRPSRPR